MTILHHETIKKLPKHSRIFIFFNDFTTETSYAWLTKLLLYVTHEQVVYLGFLKLLFSKAIFFLFIFTFLRNLAGKEIPESS